MAPATVVRTEVGSDEKIQRDVLAELKWDARLQPNEIGVIVKDGVVTLTGTVDSYFMGEVPSCVSSDGSMSRVQSA